MQRTVGYGPQAVKALSRMDRATSRRIRAKIEMLASDPNSLANNITTLRGSDRLKRLRVGDWRVIYSETLVVVDVVRIAPRGSAYE